MSDFPNTPESTEESASTDAAQVPSTSKHSETQERGSFFRSKKGLIVIVVGLLVLLFVLASFQMYNRPANDKMVRFLSSYLPYPALVVNGETVTMEEFLSEYDALETYFLDTDPEQLPPADVLEAAIADTIINKLAVQQLAERYDIQVDEAEVESYFSELVASQGSEEIFAQNLMDSYGWTEDEFKERIVESIVLTVQLSDYISQNEEMQTERRTMIENAVGRLESGESFDVVAQEVHANFGGIESDLGYVSEEVIPETWSGVVGALEVGERSEIVELPEGYAVFQLVDKKTDGEPTELHLMTITVPKVRLEGVVADYLDEVEVKRYVGEEV